jgi:hypothetical protein
MKLFSILLSTLMLALTSSLLGLEWTPPTTAQEEFQDKWGGPIFTDFDDQVPSQNTPEQEPSQPAADSSN